MTDRPLPSEAHLDAAIQEHFGLTPVKFEVLALGLDADSVIYRMMAVDGNWYFMKLRSGLAFHPASVFVPAHLHKTGVPGIVAPLETLSGKLWVVVDQWAVTLYPFIVGRSGDGGALTPELWQTLGKMVRSVHDCKLPPHIQRLVRRDSFVPRRRGVIDELDRLAHGDAPPDPVQRELAEFWRQQRGTIQAVVQRADKLGRELRDRPLTFVLCHADMHPGNVLIDGAGDMWLIDWDDVTLAPKERDLMFPIGGLGGDGVGAEQTASFLEGYGKTKLELKLLAYYRAARAVEDIAAFGEEACLRLERSEEDRYKSLQWLRSQFEPGRIVELALQGPVRLPPGM